MTDNDYDWAVDYVFVSEHPLPDGIREQSRMEFSFEEYARMTYERMLGRFDVYQDVRLMRRPKRVDWEVVK